MKEKGIQTTNCFPKSSYKKDDEIYIGCFKRELEEDFYFYNTFDKIIYKLPKVGDVDEYSKEEFGGKIKFQIPLTKCQPVWEDKPYVALPDASLKDMTLRQHACITMRVPESGIDWLDNLINKSNSSNADLRKNS